MDPVIGVGANAVTIIDSILVHIRNLKERHENNKNNEENIKKLEKEMERCQQVYTNFESIYNRAKANLNEELRDSYQVLKRDLFDKLEGIHRDMNSWHHRVQSEASSSKMGKIIRKTARFWNATKEAAEMERHSKELSQILDKCVLKTEILSSKIGDEYCAKFDVPELGDVVLDFNDGDGPERRLKEQVLKGGGITSAVGRTSLSESASGASGEATSVEGMGGIGKTIALTGLANDPDIKNEFKDGIYFMTFGSDADEFKAIYQVRKIVKQSGGEMMSKDISSLLTLEEAVSKAVEWFKGRTVLFVCDDLWSTEKNPYGFLPQLERLTKASKTCHLVLATRSHKLAGGVHVKVNIVTFNCLEETGKRARKIFLNDAGISEPEYQALSVRTRDIIGEILTKCGGHCLALAVAGRGVQEIIDEKGNVEEAIEEYSSLLKKYMCLLVDEDGPKSYTKSVFDCFEISLSLVDKWASAKRFSENFSNQFSRLCIFEKRSQITASILKYAWDIEENPVVLKKLTDLKLLNVEGNMYGFHDLVHDFCRRRAKGNVQCYHREILTRIVRAGSRRNHNQSGGSEFLGATYSSTPTIDLIGGEWWKVHAENDVEEYLFPNLARHLRYGELCEELKRLLTRFEWTMFRFRRGEQHHLMHDFENWFSDMRGTECVDEMNRIRQAIVLSWARSVASNSASELASQMQGSLLYLPGNLGLVNRYIESLNKAEGLGAWLKPLSRIWPLIPTGQRIIDVGGAVDHLAFNWETNEGVALSDGKMLWLDFENMTFETTGASGSTDRNVMDDVERARCVTWSKNGKIITCSHGNDIVIYDGQTKQQKSRICVTESIVRRLAISDDGSTICCGDSSGVVRLCKAETSEKIWGFRGLRKFVNSVAFSPDGKRIVSASRGNIVRIWDAESGDNISVLRGHQDWVTNAAFSPDGERIVSASNDKTIRIWDAKAGDEVSVLLGHEGRVTSVAFSPDGKRIVSASDDKTIRIWDAKSSDEVFVLRGHEGRVNSVAFSPDGKRVVSASSDKTVRIWDAKSSDEGFVLRAHERWLTSIAFNSDGKRIASASEDKTIRIWDAVSGEAISVLRGHQVTVTSVAFSPDGKQIVSASGDKTVRKWDVKAGDELTVFRGHREWVNSTAFSPDGKRVVSASGDGTVRIWDAESGDETSVLCGHEGWVTSVAFSPDGNRILSASRDKTVRMWNAKSGDEIFVLRGHQNDVTSVTFCPEGERIVSASNDKTIRTWDAKSGYKTSVLRGHEGRVTSVAFSPDGKHIVSASDDKTIRIWNITSGEEVSVLHGHNDAVTGVAFNPDGKRIVSSSRDKTAKIWDNTYVCRMQVNLFTSRDEVAISPNGKRIASASGDDTIRIWDVKSGDKIPELRGNLGYVNRVAFSPDGKRIVSVSLENTVSIWDAESGEKISVLRGLYDGNTSMAFSPDGKRIAYASYDGTVGIWDAESSDEISVLHGHQGRLTCVVFSPDGKRIVSAPHDWTIIIWDAESGDKISVFRGHQGNVSNVAFSPDGKRIVSTSYDKTIRTWDANSGDKVSVLRGHEGRVTNVAFSSDGKQIVSVSSHGTVIIWDANVKNNVLRRNGKFDNQQLCHVTLPQTCLCSAITTNANGDLVVAVVKDDGEMVMFELVH